MKTLIAMLNPTPWFRNFEIFLIFSFCNHELFGRGSEF